MENKNYEWVELPSKGQCYPANSPLRGGKVKVSYLTAMDENIINYPKMYKDGKLIDTILQRKIVDKNIDIHSLLRGDRDAIVLWLRRTGYGNDFPVTVRSLNDANSQFSAIVDLSKIKYHDFDLIGDENGYFMYFMKNGDVVKFKYLSIKETEELTNQIKEREENEEYSTEITDSLKTITISVNDNTDRDFISQYVDNMRAEDAFLYRGFVSDNIPRIDSKIKLNGKDGKEVYVQLLIDDAIFLMCNKEYMRVKNGKSNKETIR